jgi:hypothetical protein
VIASGHAFALLAGRLQEGERVIYAVRPDLWIALRNKLFLWWVALPWCIAVGGLVFAGRVSFAVTLPLALVGAVLLLAPLLVAIDTQYTLYAITDRRALILRNGGLRPGFLDCPFSRMDAEAEILPSGGAGGHLYFASGLPARLRDVDHTGKLAFRDLADVQAAAQALARARAGMLGDGATSTASRP